MDGKGTGGFFDTESGQDSGTIGEIRDSTDTIRDSTDTIPEPTGETGKSGGTDSTATASDTGTDRTGRTDTPGIPKRGRHFKNCGCSKCIAKRNSSSDNRQEASGAGETGASPEYETEGKFSQGNPATAVEDFSGLFAPIGKGKKPKLSDALGKMYSLVYGLAAIGGGPHWTLSNSEADSLGNVTEATIASMSTGNKKKMQAQLEKYLPPVALLGTAFIITYPRIQLTREMRRQFARSQSTESPKSAPVSTVSQTRNSVPSESSDGNGKFRSPHGQTVDYLFSQPV